MHTTPTITKPGIYPGLSFDEYAAIPAINGTALEHGRQSMAHLRAYLAGEIEDSDSEALDFGIALHAAVLEPDRLAMNAGPINPKTEKPYGRDTEKFKAWRAEHPEAIVVGPADQDRLPRMAESILRHKAAGELLTRAGENEVSAVWEHKAAKGPTLLVKGRIDRIAQGVSLVDLKSVASAEPEAFRKAVVNHGWHRKAALYVDGWKAVTGEDHHFVFVAVEKAPPYAVAVYALSDRAIEIGRAEYRTTLHNYGVAVKSKAFPAYPEDVQDLDLPGWYTRGFGENP